MHKFTKNLILITILLFLFSSCSNTTNSPKKIEEETLLGVWVYNATLAETDSYNEYKFTFGKSNGKFVGTYSEIYHSKHEKHRISFKEFEYKVKKDALIITFNNGKEYKETFTVYNNILTYKSIDYSLLKQYTYFNETPTEDDYLSLLNGKEFFDAQTKTYSNIFSLPYGNDNYLGYANRYAFADLDDNGIDELLVEYSDSGDTAILVSCLGEWEAYYVPYRGILDLKVDGTASGSGGYDNGSIHRFSFNKATGEIEYNDIVTYDTTNDLFTLNGFACNQNTVNSIIEEFYQKQDVVWLQLDKPMC